MNIEIREQAPFSVVTLGGDVDMHSSRQVRQQLLDCLARKQPLLVDLAAVTYMDSSGVASLVESFQVARKQGSEFALASVARPVMAVLKLARLDTVFPIYTSVEERLARVD